MNYFAGIPIIESTLMVENTTIKITRKFTFKERWINPLLHPVTLPFEPWCKEQTMDVPTTVPSRKVLKTPAGLIMHPAMAQELRLRFEKNSNGLGIVNINSY